MKYAKDALRTGLDRAIKLVFHGAKISSDAGLFPYRNVDEAAQLTDSWAAELVGLPHRPPRSARHDGAAVSTGLHPVGWLRRCESRRAATERLSVDPVMRNVVGGRSGNRTAASTSLVGRFETESRS